MSSTYPLFFAIFYTNLSPKPTFMKPILFFKIFFNLLFLGLFFLVCPVDSILALPLKVEVSSLAHSTVSNRATTTTPLTLINHGDVTIHSAALRFDLEDFERMGIDPRIPLEAVTSDGKILPLLPGIENGKDIAWLFLSLAAGERVDLSLHSSDRWATVDQFATASFDSVSGSGTLCNGILEFDYNDGNWGINFSSPGAESIKRSGELSVLSNCHMDFWLDSESRGRQLGIATSKLIEMGLIPSTRMKLLDGKSWVLPDGSAVMELTKGFDGFASDITWTETYTLPAGKPLLLYRSRFTTTSDSNRYIAFVDLGGGMRGRFGKLLQGKMRFKYENPKEPERILLSGRENSFLRVAWRSERCWVGVDSELGYGLGISTTVPITGHLQGSTVWAISNADFLARILSDEQENLPYAFSADNPFEFGFAFMATASGRSNIWRETGALFSAISQGQMPQISSTYGVYTKALPLKYNLVNGYFADLAAIQQLPGSAELRVAALEMDFKRPHKISATANNNNGSGPVSIQLRSPDLVEAEAIITRITLQPGETKEIDLTEVTGWLGKRERFILQIDQSAGTTLSELEIKPMGFEAPKLDVPADGMSMTDIATYFRWKQVKGALDYELQLARDEIFTNAITHNLRSETAKPYFMPSDVDLPATGQWYWRVRALELGIPPGQWSEARTFTVNKNTAKQSLLFKPAPKHPLFTMEGNRIADWSRFKDTLPVDIKPYVALNTSIQLSDDAIGYLRPIQDEMNVKAFVRTHGPGPMSYWAPLSLVEEIFQTYPNIIGIMGGESLSALYHGGDMGVYMQRLLKLCGKYGRIFYEADGSYPSENKFQALYEKKSKILEDYRGYIIFAQKNNILHRQFVTQSSVLGLYLTGDILAQGAWEDGGWYWQQVGFRGLGERYGQRGGTTLMPRNFWNLNFLMGLARGTSVFSFEGQTGTTPVSPGWRLAERGRPPQYNPSAYWTTEGELTESFKRFCLPFIRGVIEHGMVPEKDQLLAKIQLAVYNDGVPKKDDGDQYYYEWDALYRGTYGFRDLDGYPGTLMEFFPNTGRYYSIPVLPQGRRDLGLDIELLPLSGLLDADEVKSVFNKAYPTWYEGDALVSLVGDTLAVLNSNENLDETQTYVLPMQARGGFLKISGTIEPHAYLMGKFKDGNKHFWFQANVEYPERPTELTLTLKSDPKVSITPETAAQINQWDAATGELRLRLSHADGVVEVNIEQ